MPVRKMSGNVLKAPGTSLKNGKWHVRTHISLRFPLEKGSENDQLYKKNMCT